MGLIDITGQRFGRLVVLRRNGSDKDSKPVWECRCDCGAITNVRGYVLKRKKRPTRSCGCLARETATTTMKRRIKHGQSRRNKHTQLYRRWITIKQRCYDKSHMSYKNYGGRGVRMCEKWRDDFEAFAAYIGDPPEKGATIDRLDVDKNYEPGNIKWATRKEQANNRRNNNVLSFNGIEMTVTQWAEELNILPVTLFSRIRLDWDVERILTTPVKGKI